MICLALGVIIAQDPAERKITIQRCTHEAFELYFFPLMYSLVIVFHLFLRQNRGTPHCCSVSYVDKGLLHQERGFLGLPPNDNLVEYCSVRSQRVYQHERLVP